MPAAGGVPSVLWWRRRSLGIRPAAGADWLLNMVLSCGFCQDQGHQDTSAGAAGQCDRRTLDRFESEGIRIIKTPARVPRMNAWVGSVRWEVLDHIVIIDAAYLWKVLAEYEPTSALIGAGAGPARCGRF